MDWAGLFAPSQPVLELVIRGTVTFVGLMILFRLVGQREAGGLGMTDILVVVLAADAASTGLTGNAETLADGLVLVLTILFWSIALDAISYRWPRIGFVLKARPRPLIKDGHLNRRALRRELMTEEEVHSQLRLQGIEDISAVARAYIEPNGMISVMGQEGVETHDSPESPAV